MNTITEYRKARANGATAQRALQAARYNVRMAGAEFPRYVGDDATMALPRGERIVMRLEHDYDSDVAERFGASVSERTMPDEFDAPDWWQDRDGLFYVRDGRRCWRWDVVDLDVDSRDWHRAHGMARHDAWLAARAGRERAARAYRDAMDGGYVGYVVTLYDANGEEVEEDSVWGFEASDDCAGREAYDAALHMAVNRAEHWRRETAKARDAMRAAGRAFADLAHEYRKARSIGPAVCDAIRTRLESLRAQHRAALAVIVGGAA